MQGRGFLQIILFAAVLTLLPTHAQADTCGTGENSVAYMCNLQNMEDLVQVPGRPIIIGATYGATVGDATLVAIDAEHRTQAPIAMSLARRPQRPYAACPSVLDMARFSAHGIALRPGRNGRHTLYVVNHSERESIEVFALDTSGAQFRAQWIGCVVLPEGTSGNAVVPLADGGFLVTKFFDTRRGGQRPQFLAREQNAVIYRWNPRSGFSEVPNSRGISNNGVEVSPDGQWVYVTSWVNRTISRLPLNGGSAPTTANFDFMPDNIRFAPDGALLIAGQMPTIEALAACKRARCPPDWAVARVDPQSLAVSYLYWEKGTPAFAGATTALQIGNEFWLGTFRGDRVGIAPVPARPLQ